MSGIQEWLVKYSMKLNRERKAIPKKEILKLEYFDKTVKMFLEDCPNWWSNDSDGDLQATRSPDLFWQAVIAENYPYLSFNDMMEVKKFNQPHT